MNKSLRQKLHLSFLSPNLVSLLLAGSGSIILAWVGWLTWYDLTVWGKVWNKDVALIFFGSRTGEAISLGVGMRVIYYYLISLVLIISGMFTFLRNSLKASKLHQSRPLPKQRQKGTILTFSTVNPPTRETGEKMDKEEPTVKPPIKRVMEEIFFSGCLHHFGYLASHPKSVPIPEECILCQKLGDCMVRPKILTTNLRSSKPSMAVS